MTTGYDLINSYYESEKLYSTGDSDLDDLLEKAFCDGYEYAQKEFSQEEDYEKKKRGGLGKKIIKGVGLTLGAVGLYQGGKALGRVVTDKLADKTRKSGSSYEKLSNIRKWNDRFKNENAFDRFGNKVDNGIKSIVKTGYNKSKEVLTRKD